MSIFTIKDRWKMEINKKCEVCGRLLPESEFSKSYRNRCKECVAKQTKEKRDQVKARKNQSIVDEYSDNMPRPDKEVITITIEKNSFLVDYQKDDEPKKNWKYCNTKELITINGAAHVLIQGTEITTRYGKLVGNLKEIAEIFGIKIPKKK